MKALVIGSINKDIVLDVETIVKEGQTIESKKQSLFLGGKGLNQAIALSNVFHNVYFYCNVNKEDTTILNNLQNYNFDASYIQEVDELTGTAFIQVDQHGENAIVITKNANNAINIDTVKTILETFDNDDVVVLQNEINGLHAIVDILHNKNITTILNPSPIDTSITMELLSKIDYLIVNQRELLDITKKTTIEDAIPFFREHNTTTKLVVTKGSNGALYNFDTTINIPGIAVEAVDTTCAGDTFLGFFIGSIMNGESIESSLNIANKAASICVQKKGASNSIPKFNEIQ